jgi:hypothetical protein
MSDHNNVGEMLNNLTCYREMLNDVTSRLPHFELSSALPPETERKPTTNGSRY